MEKIGFCTGKLNYVSRYRISMEIISRRPASSSIIAFIPLLSVITFLFLTTFTVHHLISFSELPLQSHLLLISPHHITLSNSHLSVSFSDWPFPQYFQSYSSSVPERPYFQSLVSDRREEGEMSDKTTVRQRVHCCDRSFQLAESCRASIPHYCMCQRGKSDSSTKCFKISIQV